MELKKLVQDVAAPKKPSAPAAPTHEPLSGPELVNNIPVRAPAGPTPQLGNQSNSFIVSEEQQQNKAWGTPLPPAADKQAGQAKNTVAKSKPTAAIFFALLAVISLAAGAYLQFLADR